MQLIVATIVVVFIVIMFVSAAAIQAMDPSPVPPPQGTIVLAVPQSVDDVI